MEEINLYFVFVMCYAVERGGGWACSKIRQQHKKASIRPSPLKAGENSV